MDYSCPQCKRSIKYRFLKSLAVPVGTSWYQATNCVVACPYCCTPLAQNIHPVEKTVSSFVTVFIGVGCLLFIIFHLVWPAALVMGMVIPALTFVIWYNKVQLAKWLRWKVMSN